jgi:PHD/YefM family antitoxin component YafN of YafNO toxin-antitoxin module
MKFVSSRDIRNNPSAFREIVDREDVVLTAGGKPFAIAVGVSDEELEETLDLLRRVRALRAMARMQRVADERGLADMSREEIQKEVRNVRKAHRRSA